MFSITQHLTVLLAAAATATAAIFQSGQTVIVNGISYFAAPNSVSIIALSTDQKSSASRGEGQDLVPLTVLGDPSKDFTTTVFRSLVSNYTSSDDVFNTGFLEIIYLTHIGSGSAAVQYPLGAALTEFGTKLFMSSRDYTASATSQGQTITGWRTALPPGPYFLSASTGYVYQAYRLYPDTQNAFTEGVLANGDGTYAPLSAAVSGMNYNTVGVPSRLYFTKTASSPLAGVRLGVKDIYDIAGLKTGCGNRAYFDLYPPRTATAPAVQRLIDAGAVIVGKMKTSQFANGETATADWVDQICPFNARGDGYQQPSSSSSGPGAAMGAYSWMDIAIGSDTGGSIRGPSEVNGCFGNRPSWGLVSLDHVMPLSPVMDTAGFLCRDPVLWHQAAKVLYETNISSTNFKSFPKKILLNGFPTTADNEADSITLSFLAKVQTFLGVVNTSTPDLSSLWNAKKPAGVTDSLTTYLKNTYPILIGQQQYTEYTLPFYADYAAANGGARPFIDPVPLTRWGFAENFTSSAAETENAKRVVFRDWWANEVVVPSEETCSESLFLYSSWGGGPSYRNVYLTPPTSPTGFGVSRVSNFAEVPDMVFIIGQAAYNSSITRKEEYLPVPVNFMAAKGCDGMIFSLAEKLLEAGVLAIPKTGSMTY